MIFDHRKKSDAAQQHDSEPRNTHHRDLSEVIETIEKNIVTTFTIERDMSVAQGTDLPGSANSDAAEKNGQNRKP